MHTGHKSCWVWRGKTATAKPGDNEPHRVVPFHRRARGTQRQALARRRSTVALDRHGTAGGGKETPQGAKVPRTGKLASQTESVVDSAVPGRVTCSPPSAAWG